MRTTPTAGERRASQRSLVPLAVMAATMFLPSYRACSDKPYFSPLELSTEGAMAAAWTVPVYLFAGLFAVLTALALRSGEVSRTLRRVGLVALGLFALTTVAVHTAMVRSDAVTPWYWVAGALAATAAAAALVRRARGKSPFQIWDHLLAAFTVLAAVTGPAIYLACALPEGTRHLGPGGFLFLAAHAALAGVLGWALFRRR